MSKFRERAAEVKAAGEEARGDFTPNGVPKRMYQWWLDASPSEKASDIKDGTRRENFCHFWRVVVIWTPLLWMLVKILDGAAFVAERVSPKAAGITAAVLVVATTVTLVTTVGDWSEFFKFVGFAALLVLAAIALFALLYVIIEKTENGFAIMMSLLGLTALGYLLFEGFLAVGWWIVAIVLGVVAAIATVIGLAVAVGSWVEGSRAAKRKRAAEYEDEAWEAYGRGEGPHPYAKTKRVPGRISKFFAGVGDFLTLAVQVVRVKKWKICPLVDVDVPAKESRPMPGAPEWS